MNVTTYILAKEEVDNAMFLGKLDEFISYLLQFFKMCEQVDTVKQMIVNRSKIHACRVLFV